MGRNREGQESKRGKDSRYCDNKGYKEYRRKVGMNRYGGRNGRS